MLVCVKSEKWISSHIKKRQVKEKTGKIYFKIKKNAIKPFKSSRKAVVIKLIELDDVI